MEIKKVKTKKISKTTQIIKQKKTKQNKTKQNKTKQNKTKDKNIRIKPKSVRGILKSKTDVIDPTHNCRCRRNNPEE